MKARKHVIAAYLASRDKYAKLFKVLAEINDSNDQNPDRR